MIKPAGHVSSQEEREAFELRAVLEVGPDAAELNVSGNYDSGYANARVNDYRLGWVACLDWMASRTAQTQADHMAALSALTAERDRVAHNLTFTEQWYAVRFERLSDLGKEVGCWDAMAAIIANGTADSQETPTYAQQLVRANHRASVAEDERDDLRAKVDSLHELLLEARRVAYQEAIARSDPDYARDLIGRIDATLDAKGAS